MISNPEFWGWVGAVIAGVALYDMVRWFSSKLSGFIEFLAIQKAQEESKD